MGHVRRYLQEQRTFTDTRLTGQQHDTARQYAAAKYRIKVRNPGRKPAVDQFVINTTDRLCLEWPARRHASGDSRRAGLYRFLYQRVPFATVLTTARPLGIFGTAVRTDKPSLSLCHLDSLYRRYVLERAIETLVQIC